MGLDMKIHNTILNKDDFIEFNISGVSDHNLYGVQISKRYSYTLKNGSKFYTTLLKFSE